MSGSTLLTQLILSAAALVFIPSTALAQESAAGVLKRASAAMGDPKSIRYAGDGTGWTFGQAYKPGMPWPKIEAAGRPQARATFAARYAWSPQMPPYFRMFGRVY